MLKFVDVNVFLVSRLKIINLIRMVNRVGLIMRFKDLKDLDFEVNKYKFKRLNVFLL